MEEIIKNLYTTIEEPEDVEDEGDDIYACMVASLGDNWW